MASTKIIDYYDRRTLIAASEELKPPKTFLTATFFRDAQEFATESVDLDIYKGKRRTGAYVRRGSEGQLVGKIGFETNSFIPPYLKPKTVITPGDLRKRIPGESIFVAGRIVPQAEDFIARQLDILNNDIVVRNIEIQAMQALYDHAVVARDENKNVLATITFDRDASLTYQEAAGNLWSAAGAVITQSARRASRLTQQLSGFGVNFALLGADAADEFLKNDILQKSLSKDWAQRGGLAYDARPNGAIWLGFADGVDYWTYDEWYVDPADGVEKQLIPAKKVLYTSMNVPASVLYGGLELVDQPVGARGIKMWEIEDPNATVVQVHSAPLCCTHHPDAYAVVTVLT